MKILAIASAGGHWIQLLRLLPALVEDKIIFVSTNKSFSETVEGNEFYSVPDANRWNIFKVFIMALYIMRLVFTLKPDVVVSTGAAPGLIAIIIGKMIGAKTLWIDSIANVEKVSLSGKIALYFANRVYTQWPELANSKILFNGNVLS